MKILLLSRYGQLGSSSRLRFFQYLPFLEANGWHLDVSPLFSDEYLRALYSGQPRGRYVLAGYWRRLKALIHVMKYDLVWIEKEVLPFMPAVAERLLAKSNVPYIVDYDDAWFHRYDLHRNRLVRLILGRKIDSVMKCAALVVAGNEYLAGRARAAGARRVETVPTVVDLARYKPAQPDEHVPLVIGWIGSPSTAHYLAAVAPVMELLSLEFGVRFVAVGISEESVSDLPVEAKPWSEEGEVQSIREFDIGIMPVPDSPFERGKCGYKLIQYMACGLPVVASPVGVNKQIVVHGANGFLADDLDQWEQALRELLSDHDLRRRMGSDGRERMEKWYSLQVQAPRLQMLMRGVLS